jgi:rod shape-determining protein MreC
MREFLRRLGVPLLFVGLVLLCLVSMSVDRRDLREGGRDLPWWSGAVLDIAVPIQKGVTTPVEVVRRVFRDYVALLDLRAENQRLHEELVRLGEENLQLQEALVASERLQAIAGMRTEFETPMLPSEIVGLDVSPWFRSVLLDRGRGNGVRPGMPVITDEGVVGLVTATSQRASKAMLLLDAQSAIDCVVQRSRARGIAKGQGTGGLEFEFVVRGADVQQGDVVITSGIGGTYPKGLRVGTVESLSSPDASLVQKATLRPAVDLSRLEQVFVLFWRSPTLEILYGDEVPAAGEPLAGALPPGS